ncbi:MAG: DUF599 domain-containing protein [Planctomycetota bacterium]
MEHWQSVFQSVWDYVGAILFVLVFPVYHAIYPVVARHLPSRAAQARTQLYRHSWIRGLLERGDLLMGVHQARNLTMMNSLLVSSTVILIGLTAALVPQIQTLVDLEILDQAGARAAFVKLTLLILILAIACSYFMGAMRHIGHFTLVLGADLKLVEEHDGDPVEYFSGLMDKASSRHTLGMRTFYSALPVLLWVFDTWLFVGITAFWGAKFMGFQDFLRKGNDRHA